MGCCATNRDGKGVMPTADNFSGKENEMKLNNITIVEF